MFESAVLRAVCRELDRAFAAAVVADMPGSSCEITDAVSVRVRALSTSRTFAKLNTLKDEDSAPAGNEAKAIELRPFA